MAENEIEKYKIAEGLYIKESASDNEKNESAQYFSVHEPDGKHWNSFYLCRDKLSKHIIIKEDDIQKAVKAIHPNYDFRSEDVVNEFARYINFSKPSEYPDVEIIKLEKVGNSATYYVNGKYNLDKVPFLSENLSLEQQENIEKIKAYSEIGWLSISATSKNLAAKMEALGYVLEHSGRSGFESRNSYTIRTKDGILTPEIYQKMQQDLQACKDELAKEKLIAFDIYFDEQSSDSNKVYALVETGYDYHRTRTVDDEKYYTVAQMRTACTADYRQGFDHTYLNLMINKERMKQDKRNFIVLEVPQDMIGMVVGKGGRNIKELEQKFGKKFKVVQSSKEKEEQRRKQHQEDFQKLQKDVVETVGDYVLIADEQDLQKAVVDYMDVNVHSLPFAPSVDELKDIYTALCSEKERKIAEQQRLEAERIEKHQQALIELQNDMKDSFGKEFVVLSNSDIAQKMVDYLKENKDNLPLRPNMDELEIIQKNLINERDEQIAEQKRQDQAATESIFEEADRLIRNYGWDNHYELPPDEVITKGIAEYLEYKSDNPTYARVAATAEKEIILLLQKERLSEQIADKKFNEITTQVIEKFFNSDESGGHGEYFFSSVGKARRSAAYDYITGKVMTKLGLSDNKNHPLSIIQEHRRYRYREKVIDFEENYSGRVDYGKYTSQEKEVDQPVEVKEATVENLAALWGANLKSFKGK
ncbi:MAG: KH domain-containing protein [Alphaproteobacteria bacterium]|nr:KH domain-containing protein [Alphaproteobacteria bacterium]